MSDHEMSDPEYWVRSWLRKANADARAMHLVLENDDALTGIACFHAQQCVEKCLKAFLTAHGQVVEKTHDLTDLVDLCSEIEPGYQEFRTVCSELSGYAVEVRYPGEKDPSHETAHEMVGAADRIEQFTRDTLGLD